MTTTTKKPTTLIEALIEAQKDFPEIGKDSEADAVKFKYKYASLPAIFRIILPVLHKHGLGLTQTSDSGHLITTLHHVGGETLISTIEMPSPRSLSPQDYGKAHSYYRRYEVNGMLALSPDDDIDAQDVPTPGPLPPPSPEPEAVTDPIQAVCERLATEDNLLVKAWTLEPFKNRGAALKGIRDLVDAVVSEAGEDSDIYKLTRQKMNTVIDERAAD